MREDEEQGENYFSRLPDSIIHHILYKLPPKTARRTSQLSKTWHHLWSTFPSLDFFPNYSHYIQKQPCPPPGFEFQSPSVVVQNHMDNFLNLVHESIHRRLLHLQGNDDISSCVIRRFLMSVEDFPNLDLLAPRMDHWLGIALAKNVAEIFISISTSTLNSNPSFFRVSTRVLYADSLRFLMLCSCALEGNFDLKLPKLQSLSFVKVRVSNEQLFRNLAASCPSVESLLLSVCYGLNCVRSVSSLPKLKHVELYRLDGLESIQLKAPKLERLKLHRQKRLPWEISLDTCTALRVLELEGDDSITCAQFQNLMSKLPSIEQLKLRWCSCLETVKISSTTLKNLTLQGCSSLLAVETDTPNLRSVLIDQCQSSKQLAFSFINTSLLLTFHFAALGQDIYLWSKLMNFLHQSSFFEDLKFVAYRPLAESMIIHEKLSDVSLNAINYDEDWYICVSSMNYSSLVDELFLFKSRRPKALYVVCSCDKPIELLSEKFMDPKGSSSWKRDLCGFDVSASQGAENEVNPECDKFLMAHSTIPYQLTTITLKWGPAAA